MNGRPILCHCGTCKLCQRREYQRTWRKKNPTYMRDYIVRYHDTPEKRQRAEAQAAANRFTPEEDALLGTMPDVNIAKQIGKTPHAIWKRRKHLDIPAYIKRGQRRNEGGYIVITLAPDDPLIEMTRHNRSVQEHRLVMARHLGRPLTRDEFVHHRNGIKDDNRLENLELWTRSHPDGQRVEDVLEWCVEFIERYSREVLEPDRESVFSVEHPA